MTLREIINQKLELVRNQPDMPPALADQVSTELSAILGSLSDREAELRQKAYRIAVDAIESDKPIGFAEMLMKSSESYADYKKAEGLYKSVLEVIRSLRAKVRRAEIEYKDNIS